MATIQIPDAECAGEDVPAQHETGSTMNETNRIQHASRAGGKGAHLLSGVRRVLEDFHRDDSGVAMTEYILVFTLISFGATVALIGTAAYIKAYRDFMVWWFGHPAV